MFIATAITISQIKQEVVGLLRRFFCEKANQLDRSRMNPDNLRNL
jgi:hypothetical protein